jgi:hypothetical protein
MLLKNKGEKKAILGCGQYNLVIEIGETKEIPNPLFEAFKLRFPDLVDVTSGDQEVTEEEIIKAEAEHPEEVEIVKPKKGRFKKEAKDA